MQDFNTIVGVIQMRSNECSFPVIRAHYHIGTRTIQLILKRFEASGLTLEDLRSADPRAVEDLFYPPEQVRRKDVPCRISSTTTTESTLNKSTTGSTI